MSERNFRALLENQWSNGKFVSVGLDSEYQRIPAAARGACVFDTVVNFNRAIVNTTKDFAGVYKPNSAFYEALGPDGFSVLWETINYIHKVARHVPVILDAKRGDIGKTNEGYVKAAFEHLQADAITVHPYLGKEALAPFLGLKGKGVIVLCRTSNSGAGEFQDLHTLTFDPRSKPADVSAEDWLRAICDDSMQLYERVALNVATSWNEANNCLLVVGATYPVEAKRVRARVGNLPFLIPGVGTQGGDVEATVMACKDNAALGMVINSSSGIIFASDGDDFAEAARAKTIELNDLINKHRSQEAA